MSRITVCLLSFVLFVFSGCAMAAYPMTTAMGIDIGVSTILGQYMAQQDTQIAAARPQPDSVGKRPMKSAASKR